MRYQGVGSNWVQCHRVWNAERFFKTQIVRMASNEKEVTLVSLATEAEYRKFKEYKS